MNVPTGYTELDLVGFTDKGTYNPNAGYVKNDIVHYNDGLWRCLKDDVTGVTPVEGDKWTLWIAPASGVSSFNGRQGAVVPETGDYSDNQISLSTTKHIGGGTQTLASQAIDALISQTTPVGAVIPFASRKDGDSLGLTGVTPTGVFPPNSTYLVCDGKPSGGISVTEYSQLADYFNTVYGNTYYFNAGGLDPGTGKFALPDWSADFPTNGVLCIKAK